MLDCKHSDVCSLNTVEIFANVPHYDTSLANSSEKLCCGKNSTTEMETETPSPRSQTSKEFVHLKSKAYLFISIKESTLQDHHLDGALRHLLMLPATTNQRQ